MKKFLQGAAAVGALIGVGLIFVGPTLVTIGVGVSIFMAPQVAALGLLPQLGLAAAGGFGAGLASRMLSFVTLVPLTAVLAVMGGVETNNSRINGAVAKRRRASVGAPDVAPSAVAETKPAAATFNASADAAPVASAETPEAPKAASATRKRRA